MTATADARTKQQLQTKRTTGRLRWAPNFWGLPDLRALADLAVFEDLVEHVGEGGGAAAGGVLRVLEGAG
jgi:hypothetical protein